MEEHMYEEEPTSPDASADQETLTHKRPRGRPPKVKTILQLQQQEGDTKRRKKNLLGEKSGKKLGRSPKKKPLVSADSKIEAGAANIIIDDSNSHKQEGQVFVGQTVKGVVDGSFDAGYLMSVGVGVSDTVYRGVIFGPGLSLPLNKDNDVAPKVKMSARKEEAEAAPPTTPPPAPSVVAAHSSSTHIDDSASMYHGNQHIHHQNILQVQDFDTCASFGFGSSSSVSSTCGSSSYHGIRSYILKSISFTSLSWWFKQPRRPWLWWISSFPPSNKLWWSNQLTKGCIPHRLLTLCHFLLQPAHQILASIHLRGFFTPSTFPRVTYVQGITLSLQDCPQ